MYGPAPAAHPEPVEGPLDGLRIVDLTQVWAAPFATVMLAELGAEVIHIESPTRPDMTRFWTVGLELEGDLWEKSGYFNQHNRHKKSLILDLAYDSAREVLTSLVAKSDILINNFSRRVMENWGFTYEAMCAVNPRLVYATMPSYGATGPHRDYVSFGDSLQAATGIVRWRGYDAETPMRAGPIPDPYSALTIAGLLLAALRVRDAEGRSVYIDLAQRDAVVRLIGEELLAFQANGVEPHQFENEHREWAPHRAYRCAGEDRWVTIVARTDAEWQAICAAMYRHDLAVDPRFATAEGRREHREEIDAAIEAWTAKREAKWVEKRMLLAGVPAAMVLRASEFLEHPQYLHRNFFPWVDHPVAGERRLHTTPIYLHGLPHARTGDRAPLFGEHTREVLREIAGLSDERISELEAEGAAGGIPEVEGVTIWGA